MEQLYDSAIPFLNIYPKKIKILIWKDTRTPMFIAALLITAKIRKQLKCPSTDEWMFTWDYISIYIHDIYIYIYICILIFLSIYIHIYIYTHIHTHIEMLLSHKKDEILPSAVKWMNLENILLIEMSEKDKHCVTSLMCGIWKIIQINLHVKQKQTHRYRKQICGCQRGEVREKKPS